MEGKEIASTQQPPRSTVKQDIVVGTCSIALGVRKALKSAAGEWKEVKTLEGH